MFRLIHRKLKNFWIMFGQDEVDLWVDDVRKPPDGYVWATTAREAIGILKNNVVHRLSLDHDLGPPGAGTGYDVALWLEENFHSMPQYAKCHSSNPVGRDRIRAALQSAKRRLHDDEANYTYRSVYRSL